MSEIPPILVPTGPLFSNNESLSVVSDSLWPSGLYNPWNSPGQNTGVGSCFLLQGIFPTSGSNPGVPHCRQILEPPGKPLFSLGRTYFYWSQLEAGSRWCLNTRGLRNVFLILTKLMLSNDIQRVDWRSSIHSYSALLQNCPWKIKTQARWLIGLHCCDPATEVLLLNKGLTLCRSVVPRVWIFVISGSEQLVCFILRSW